METTAATTTDDRQLFTRAEAVAFIKSQPRGVSFALHYRSDAPVAGDPDREVIGGLTGYVNLTRAEAIRMAGDMISPSREESGARIPVRARQYSSVFNGKPTVTVWIG